MHVVLPFTRMAPFSFSEDEGDDDFVADGIPMTDNEVGVRREGGSLGLYFITLMRTGSSLVTMFL